MFAKEEINAIIINHTLSGAGTQASGMASNRRPNISRMKARTALGQYLVGFRRVTHDLGIRF